MSALPTLYERRCPQCGALGSHAKADLCTTCGVALTSVPAKEAGEAPQVFVYRPWVPWVLAAIAVAFPFLPIPFIGGPVGFALKLAVSVSLIKAIRDYQSGMR